MAPTVITLITVEFICNGSRVPSDKLVPNSGNWQKRVIPAPKEKGMKVIDEPELGRNVDLRGIYFPRDFIQL